MKDKRISIELDDDIDITQLYGSQDVILHDIQERFPVKIIARDRTILIEGEEGEVQLIQALFDDLIKMVRSGAAPTKGSVDREIDTLRAGGLAPSALLDDVLYTYRGRAIRPKTPGQKTYTDAIKSHTITFCVGPAGTGKTYLAMALGLAALANHEVGRIVLTRPVVEAGESLGYLPGTLSEKVDPFIRPLTDALFDLCDGARVNDLARQGIIEIAPLAYMRGRTLNDAFVILDEGQNTTPEQMKIFLTRLGFGSKMVITGDITQIDLPKGKSGLKDALEVVEGIEGIAHVELTSHDVVRHSLVGRITAAYDRRRN